MADEVLKPDPNGFPVCGGVTDDANEYTKSFRVDPTTGGMLTTSSGISVPTETEARAALILTTSYVAGTVVDTGGVANQLLVLLDFTIGSLTTAEIKVEFSADGTDYYQETFSSISTTTDTVSLGLHQIAATGTYRLAIPIMDRYIKVSVKGTGTVTGSSMTTTLITGTV